MKKKLLKTLLLAVCLLGGYDFARAVDVASHDINDSTTPFTIYDSNRITASYVLHDGSADDYYVKYSCGNMNAVAFAYYNFASSVSDAESVTIAFDFNITKVSGHELISIADADFHTGTKAGFSSKSNTGYGSNGAIFNLGCWREGGADNFAINSTKKTNLTATCLDAWCHANVVINNATRKVSYTITSLDGETTYAEVSNVDFLSANAQRCSQIDIYIGTNASGNAVQIDNLIITKTVSETSHTYTIKAFDGATEVATIASSSATEGSSYSEYIPKCITDATGKYYILNDGSNQNLNNYSSFYTMGTADVVKSINYTLDESIAYYAEAENMDGNRYSSPSTSNKLSKGTAYCAYKKNETGYLKSKMGLTYPVIADIEAGIYGRKASTATLQLINGSDVTTDIGTQAVTEGGSATWSKEKQLIPVGSEFYMSGDNETNASKWALDYVIIRKAYYVGGATTSISNNAYIEPTTLPNVTFTFSTAFTSEEASFAVLNSATAKLYDDSDNELTTGSLSIVGSVVTANFDSYALTANSTYKITLPEGAVGYDGQISNTAVELTIHTSSVADGTYYLKNKATGAYFAAGQSWTTQAITNSIGHYIEMNVQPDGKYILNTHIYNNASNHYLNGLWCDGASTSWTIASDGEGYYTINDGTNNLTAGELGAVLSLAAGTGDNAKWSLLTESEWKTENVARLSEATYNNGVDATFYIPAANFNRNDNDENAKWNGSPTLVSGTDWVLVTNYNAQKFDTIFDVYQNLTGLKAGIYKLSVQGFYRNGTTDDGNAILYAGSYESPICNIRSAGVTSQNDEQGFTTANAGATSVYVPNLQKEAALAFNNGYYNNELYFVVADEGSGIGNIRLGVKKDVVVSNDWTVFDNFQLTYYGTSVSVPVGSAGFATYANHDFALDFSGVEGLVAFTATVSGDEVTFTPATQVPAGTGLLLKGATADVPVIASAAAIADNLLYAPTTAITGNSLVYDDDTYYNYILSQPAGKNIGFYRANNSNVAVGKAYLRIPKAQLGRQLTFIGLDDETTGISDATRLMDDVDVTSAVIYDLQGRRVAQPAKGLYIMNGKKVVIK